MTKADISVKFAGIEMKNPVLTASGTCGYGAELDKFGVLEQLGGIMVKGTTVNPRPGNNTPRIAETPAGLLNAVGLQNPGIDHVLEHELPWLLGKNYDLAVLVNIAGATVDEYGILAEKLDGVQGIAGLEVNISCPNVKAGGMAHGATAAGAAEVTRLVRSKTKLPIIMKLSPNVTDITEIARAVEAEGADAVSLVNTFLGMKIDIEKGKPLLANTTGGLSGPAIRPIAVRMVYQVAQAVNIPIVGMGGIVTAEDAIEFIMAGASAVAVGSGTMVNPKNPVKIAEGIGNWLTEHGYSSLDDIRGIAWK